MLRPADLFDLGETEHAALFEGCEYAWEPLRHLKFYLESNTRHEAHHRADGRCYIGEPVFIGEGTVIEDGAMIKGPTIIGKYCQIRHNAYIRGNVVIGDGCVVGNACELKNSWLFNKATVPHFNYVGDSILGYKAHLGAGVKISNVKLVPGNVMVTHEGQTIDSGLRKFGALLGDHIEVGCNSVLNPGTIIGPHSIIYPNTNFRGVLPAHRIVKNQSPQQVVERQSR